MRAFSGQYHAWLQGRESRPLHRWAGSGVSAGQSGNVRIDPSEILAGLGVMASRSSLQRVTRPAIRKCASVVSKAAKANLRDNRRTGALQASIGYVIRTAKHEKNKMGQGNIYAVVGPREGFTRPAPEGRIKTRKYTQTIRTVSGTVIPAKYAHFLEKGTSRYAAEPFLRPAFDANKDKCIGIMATDCKAGIAKELARVRTRGRRVRGAA